jgi:hypothetical protein
MVHNATDNKEFFLPSIQLLFTRPFYMNSVFKRFPWKYRRTGWRYNLPFVRKREWGEAYCLLPIKRDRQQFDFSLNEPRQGRTIVPKVENNLKRISLGDQPRRWDLGTPHIESRPLLSLPREISSPPLETGETRINKQQRSTRPYPPQILLLITLALFISGFILTGKGTDRVYDKDQHFIGNLMLFFGFGLILIGVLSLTALILSPPSTPFAPDPFCHLPFLSSTFFCQFPLAP